MNSHEPTPSPVERLITFAAFASVFVVYVAFQTKSYYYDGVFFAQAIERSAGFNALLVHPNHLIYNVFGYVLYKGTQLVGLKPRAIEVLQFANSVAGALGAYVLFRILREQCPRYVAWCLAFLFAFSITWWRFSTDADAYIPSTLFLLICFYLVLPHRRPRPLLLIICFSISVFFHQLAILFYPVIILGLLWQAGGKPERHALIFALGAAVVVFGTYWLLFVLVSDTIDAQHFLSWITSYSPDASFSFNVLSNLRYTLRGHVRLFFGGRVGLIRDLINPFIVGVIVVGGTLTGVLLWRLIRRLRRTRIALPIALDPLLKLCLVWISIYVAFLFFWLPHNTFYRLFYLPAIVLLVATIISPRLEPRREYSLALFVAVIAVANFLFSVYASAHVQKNPPLALALEFNRDWHEKTIVYYAKDNADNILFQYFNPDSVWKPMSSLKAIDGDLLAEASKGNKVWLDVSGIEQIANEPRGTEWLSQHEREGSRRELIDHAYKIRFIEIVPLTTDVNKGLESSLRP